MIWAVWWGTALNEIKCEVKLKAIVVAQQGQLKLKNKIQEENQKIFFFNYNIISNVSKKTTFKNILSQRWLSKGGQREERRQHFRHHKSQKVKIFAYLPKI